MDKEIILLDSILENGISLNAGSKARNDIAEILSDCRKEYIYAGNNPLSHFAHYLKESVKLRNSKNICIVQYPFYIKKSLENRIKKWIPGKSILLIHDITSLRDMLDDQEIKKEIDTINNYRCVISHNYKMSEWLRKNGCKSHIIDLDFFDYLRAPLERKSNKRNYAVAFAGNLSREKSGFLYKDISFDLELYGANYKPEAENPFIHYHGSFPAENLPAEMTADFGLVWDGEEADICSGNFGNYLRYNNPHKASLYISSMLPVIIWKEAAAAEFIVKNNLGIAVESMNEIPSAVHNISDEQYFRMKKNAEEMSEKMADGFFTKKAVSSAVAFMSESINR